MTFDPASLDLKKLFVDSKMFESRDRWRRAGFEVFERSGDNKIMVASHPSAPGYLFKKYVNDIELSKQLENYERRIEGFKMLRSFIADRVILRIRVPQKWLHELPSNFGSRKEPSYVLIVERLKLLSDSDSKRAYGSIDDALLKELCIVLYEFRGLDSIVGNAPFTEDGKIAFVDTEHWDRNLSKKDRKKKPFLNHIHGYLSRDSNKLAEKIFKRLGD